MEKKESIDSRVAAYGFDQDALMARRATLISLLRSLQKSLDQNDDLTTGPKAIKDVLPFPREAGIKNMVRKPLAYNNEKEGTRISHRGVQLSKELHAKFAHSTPGEDQVKKMRFKDFRGYLAAVGRSHENAEVTQNIESWRLYMSDLGALDEDGDMTPAGMVAYRALIEHEHSLEMDLLKLEMELLPADLMQWEKNKFCFDRIDNELVEQENLKLERRMGKKRAEKELKKGPLGEIETRDLQQLLADTGSIFTFEQIEGLLLVNQNFYTVMAQLRARNARKNEFADDIQASKIDAEKKDTLYRDGFLAWMMSGRPKPKTHKFEKFFINAKTGVVRGMREFCRSIAGYRRSVEKLCLREILVPKLLGGLKMDTSSYQGKILIGNADDVDDGMSATLTYTKIERAEQEFSSMKLPKGTGTAFIMDLLVMSTATKQEVLSAVAKCTNIINEHLDYNIQKLPLFHSWKVFAFKNDVDDSDVIRFALCFDRTASIDYALRELDMGFSFSDLLTELSVDMKCSLSIVDLLDSKRVTLEKDFSLFINPKLQFARGLLVKILEEVLLLKEEEAKLAETIAKESQRNQAKYDERTKQSHEKQPEFGRIRIGVDAVTETKTGQQLETQQMRAEIKRRNNWRVMGVLRGTKGMEWDFSFRNITDAFFGSKLVSGYLPDWAVPEYFKTPGSATETWRRWSKNVLGFMTGMFTDIANHQEMLKMEKMRQAEAEAKRLGGMGELAQRREQLAKEKKALAHRLEALGIKMDPNLLKKDTRKKSDQELLSEWKTTQTKSQLSVLQMYGALKNSCIGVSGLTMISGTNKFEVNLQGFDIFEVAPELDDLDELESLMSNVGSSSESLAGM
jgi:hypothetical protein